MLRAQGIHKIYKDGKKDLHILQGIDLEIKKGETVAVVGPSGAGKSTLLHILGGIDRPDSGKVFLGTRDFYVLPDNERAWLRNQQIGFVFQFYHLLPEFTVLENAMMPGLIKAQGSPRLRSGQARLPSASLGTGKAQGLRQRVKNLLQELGLKDRLFHRPANFQEENSRG